jgi:transcriptional regulator with XRE-family HTH domain
MTMGSDLEARLGVNIRARRIAAGMSQVELAERANVSSGAVKHLEQGSGATTRTLTRVLKALNAEEWIDQLAPPPLAFNPLVLLEAERKAARVSHAPRVRRARRSQ